MVSNGMADEATYADNWGRRAGCDELYVARSARDNTPQFFPTPNRSCVVHDDPREEDDARTAEALGTSLQGFLPFEPEMVGPALDYRHTRDLFTDRSLDDLYVKGSSESREVFELDQDRGGVQPRTALQSETRGPVLGETFRHGPAKTFEREVGDQWGASAPYSAPTIHGQVSLLDTNRADCPAGGARFGSADPRALPAPAAAPVAEVALPPTNRADCPAGGARSGNLATLGSRAPARTAAPAPTKKEWLVLHPRQFGNPRADGLPEKGAVSGADLPRTTGRETLIHDQVAGQVTGNASPGPLAGAGNGARATHRQTLSSAGTDPANATAPHARGAVVDLAALRRELGVTHRVVTPSDAYTGPYQGRTVPGYLRQILGLRVDETSRSVLSDASGSYLRPGHAPSAGEAAPRRGARWVLEGLRGLLAAATGARRPAVLAGGPSVAVGAAEARRAASLRPEAAQSRALGGGAQPGVGVAAARATAVEICGGGAPRLAEVPDGRFDPSVMEIQGASNPYAPPPVHVLARAGAA